MLIHLLDFLLQFSPFGKFAPRILLWEAFVSLALLGLGLALLRLLRQQHQPFAVAACCGVALWLFFGGWLNLTHTATPRTILVLLSVGFLLGLWEISRPALRARLGAALRSIRSSRSTLIAGGFIAIYFAAIFAAHLRPTAAWNRYDDPQAYMAYADKASSLGSLQSDPFSERRTNTGLGGGIFLNVTMLAAADDTAMGYIDGAFGYIAYLLAVWSLLRRLGLSDHRAIAVLYLIPVFSLGKLNLSIVYLSAAMLLAILLILLDEENLTSISLRTGLVLGVLLGAACTVKSSNIPFGGLFLIFCAVALAVRARSAKRLLPFALATLPILLIVLPWMLQLHHDQATYLCPLLGRGYHASAYGILPLPAHSAPTWQSLVVSAPSATALLLAGVFSYLLARRLALPARPAVFAYIATSVLSTFLIGVSVAGESLDRFTLPFYVPCVLLLAGFILLAWRDPRCRLVFSLAVGFVLVWTFAFAYVVDKREHLDDDIAQLYTLTGARHIRYARDYDVVLTPATMQANIDEVKRAQFAVPPGNTIMEATETAYGYDWHRNPIFIADYPGMAGLPPGFPIFSNYETVRLYLLHCGIHFLIYDRKLREQANDFDALRSDPTQHYPLSKLLHHPSLLRAISSWSRMESLASNHVRLLFEQIAATHPPLYDDGRIEVIPLDE
jgi:hypothetical protein